jgi:N-acetylneuraminate synthase
MTREPVNAPRLASSLGADDSVYVVAEIGSNHNRDLGRARELIETASAAGANAVKFQLFEHDSLYPPNAGRVETPMGDADLHELFTEFALPSQWLEPLREAAGAAGVSFLCTAFDEHALDALTGLDVPAVKIASPELNHLPLLRKAARLRRPMICSTGLCTIADVAEAVSTICGEWPDPALVLLQCVSAYPAPAEQSNLRVIDTLRRVFGFPTGLSDHSMDFERVPGVAVAVGAVLVEKHLTLDRSLSGPDHPFSLEPDEFQRMVSAIRSVSAVEPQERLTWAREQFGDLEDVLGTGFKTIQPAEQPIYPNDKRSIHAIDDVHPGETLTPRNIRVLRSERNLIPGLHPRYWELVCGAIATAPVAAGEGVGWRHLVQRAGAP